MVLVLSVVSVLVVEVAEILRFFLKERKIVIVIQFVKMAETETQIAEMIVMVVLVAFLQPF